MGEYFECELRTKSHSEEAFVSKIWLRLLPRIGENIQTVLSHDKKSHDFLVTGIRHFAGDKFTGHRIIIYVTHTPFNN